MTSSSFITTFTFTPNALNKSINFKEVAYGKKIVKNQATTS